MIYLPCCREHSLHEQAPRDRRTYLLSKPLLRTEQIGGGELILIQKQWRSKYFRPAIWFGVKMSTLWRDNLTLNLKLRANTNMMILQFNPKLIYEFLLMGHLYITALMKGNPKYSTSNFKCQVYIWFCIDIENINIP